jgi:hypothetical protein
VGSANVSRLTISNAIVHAESFSIGSGIGSGIGNYSKVCDVSIIDSEVSALSTSGSAVGGIERIRLGGRLSLDLNCTVVPIQASSLIQIASNAAIVGCGVSPPFFANTPSIDDFIELAIMYDEVTESISANLPYSPSISYLEVGKVDLPSDSVWGTCAWNSSYSHCFPFNSSRSQSFVVSVQRYETYILSSGSGSVSGRFESDGNSSFRVDDNPIFLPDVEFLQMGTPSATVSRTPTPTRTVSASPIRSTIQPTRTASNSRSASYTRSASYPRSRTPSPTPPSPGLSTGAIVGITLGGIGLIVIVCLGIWIFHRRQSHPAYDSLDSRDFATGVGPLSNPDQSRGTYY